MGLLETKDKLCKVKEGDVIWAPAGEIHRHGAAKGYTFTHISVTKGKTKLTQIEK